MAGKICETIDLRVITIFRVESIKSRFGSYIGLLKMEISLGIMHSWWWLRMTEAGWKNRLIVGHTYRNACNMLRDGAPPCGPAGARNFMNKTRTMLHRNMRFSIIDIQTGATSMLLYGVSFIQQLCAIAVEMRCQKPLDGWTVSYGPSTECHQEAIAASRKMRKKEKRKIN